MKLDLAKAIERLDLEIESSPAGLPAEVFLFVSRVTPLVNVDLLLRGEDGRTLLTWREDEFYGPGWHVPGGIIRFQEAAAARVHATARIELGATVSFDPDPIRINESIASGRTARGHFVSLLYRCRLTSGPDPKLKHIGGSPAAGQWAWHLGCPHDLIHEQRPYGDLLV